MNRRRYLLIVKSQLIVSTILISLLIQQLSSKSTSQSSPSSSLSIPSPVTPIPFSIDVATDFRGNIIDVKQSTDNQPSSTTQSSPVDHNQESIKHNNLTNGSGTISPIGSKIEGIYSDDYDDNDESMWLDLGAYSGDHGSYGWYVDHPVGSD